MPPIVFYRRLFMSYFLIFLTAISLSMDAFSLSLIYGTLEISNRNKIILSFIVGFFHFIMPLFGMLLGNLIFKYNFINTNYLSFIVLSFIGIEMIISSFDDEDAKIMKISDYFLFAFAVSIDSFSVGITFTNISNNVLLSLLMISFFSSFFTLFGLFIGNKIEKLIGKLSTIIGGVVLVLIGISYIF